MVVRRVISTSWYKDRRRGFSIGYGSGLAGSIEVEREIDIRLIESLSRVGR